MTIYALLPFIIMSICSILIIIKTYKMRRGLRLKSKYKQLYIILFTTNLLFVCLVSPLIILNILSSFEIILNSNSTNTIFYILAYSNHALVKSYI